MNASRNNLHIIFTLLVICASLTTIAIHCYYAWPFTTDDAYISLRYATQLTDGHGLRFNSQQAPIEGYSNFAWVMLAAFFIQCGLPVLLSIKCVALLCLLASIYFLYQLARTFLPPLPASLPIYLLSHYNGVVWWTVSGLETSLFVALVLFVSWQSVRTFGFKACAINDYHFSYHPHKPTIHLSAWLLCCMGLLLLALSRFDGVVWGLVIVLFVADYAGYRLSNLTPYAHKLMLIFMLGYVIPLLGYWLWRWQYFGHIFPNSYLCKLAVKGHYFDLVLDYSYIALPCLALSLPYFFEKKEARHLLLWLPSLLYTLMLWRANPDIAYFNRLFLGAFSVFCLLPVLGVARFFEKRGYSLQTTHLLTTLVILLFTAVFIPKHSSNVIKNEVAHYQERSTLRRQVADILNRRVGENETVLLGDCGIIPYLARTDIQFIDSQCLNNHDMPLQTLNQYTTYLMNNDKPHWVVDTYYPLWQRGNSLNEALRRQGFFTHYQLVYTFKAHRYSIQNDQPTPQEVDYIYRIYKRIK